MTSKVQPAANYNLVPREAEKRDPGNEVVQIIEPMTQRGRQKCSADYWTVERETLGTRLRYIWWAKKQRTKWWNSFKMGKYFGWLIKQLLAFVEYEELEILIGGLKAMTSRLGCLQMPFRLIVSNSSFVIRVNLLHPWSYLFLCGLLVSLKCLSTVLNNYSQVSLNLKVIWYLARIIKIPLPTSFNELCTWVNLKYVNCSHSRNRVKLLSGGKTVNAWKATFWSMQEHVMFSR